jgi:hypothetical protein
MNDVEKVDEVRNEVKEVMESTASREVTPEEQQVVDEQDRQKRVDACRSVIQKILQEHKCDLDVTVILKAGQVIPRIGIVPLEVLQAQQGQQGPAPQNSPI